MFSLPVTAIEELESLRAIFQHDVTVDGTQIRVNLDDLNVVFVFDVPEFYPRQWVKIHIDGGGVDATKRDAFMATLKEADFLGKKDS